MFFQKKNTLMLLGQTNLNEHAIELEGDKQRFYRPIYNLNLV